MHARVVHVCIAYQVNEGGTGVRVPVVTGETDCTSRVPVLQVSLGKGY